MKSLIYKATTLLLALVCFNAAADTFKCVRDGKTVYSDVPCAANAARVDARSDSISRSQRMQAEGVYRNNRSQLSELEYQNAYNRSYLGQGNVVESSVPDKSSSNKMTPLRRVR